MNFPKLCILLLVDGIGFFDPSLSYRHVEASLVLRKYNCPRIIRNGYIKQLKSRAKVSCNYGFRLFGPRYIWCDGLHKGAMPVCIRPGCALPSQPSHGTWTFSRNDALGSLVCDEGYITSEEAHIYCDGLVWGSVGQRPTCTGVVNSPNTTCDFEDPGLCGWSQDFYHDFDWRRRNFSTPSGHLRTGPSFDHTFGKGFAGVYIYIEASSPRITNETARLYSPIYPANYSEDACFTFWYHMYGSTMGSVNVYVLKKGDSMSGQAAVFSLSGNKGDIWRQAFVALESQDSSFQIVLEGVVGHGYEGDAAVDDVKLGHGAECLPPPRPSPTTPTASAFAYTEPTVFEVSKEGADTSSLNFSPLVSSGPELFLTTPDSGRILFSIPSASVNSPTLDTVKSQTLYTQNMDIESSLPPTSSHTVPPTEIITLKLTSTTPIIRKVSTGESDPPQKLTTVTNNASKNTRYTSTKFTDMQSSAPVSVSKTLNSRITSTPIQALSTHLYSGGAVVNVTDLKAASRATSNTVTTAKYKAVATTTIAPTSSLPTNYGRKEILPKYSSVATTSARSSPYFTQKITPVKQFVTTKTTSAPVTTSRTSQQRFSTYVIPLRYKSTSNRFVPIRTRLPERINTQQRFSTYAIPLRYNSSLNRFIPIYTLLPARITTKYLPVLTTPTVMKRETLSFISDKKTSTELDSPTSPLFTIKTPSSAPSSRRNSAYQFLTSKLQQYMSPNKTPARSKVAESSGWSAGATLGIASAGSVATLAAVFLAVRLARRRLVRKLQSREPDDSDVRFLTSDEILDFNIARPGDCDCDL